MCGKKGGASFKSAIRPTDMGNGYLECPVGTVPCDEDIFPPKIETVNDDSQDAEDDADAEDDVDAEDGADAVDDADAENSNGGRRRALDEDVDA